MKKENLYILFLILVASFLIAGCSTEKNTLATRSFHNMNARYNAYFNGNESFKQGVKKVDKALVDDYSRILPIFSYSNPIAAKTCYGEMDKAIKKASKVIKLHSITAKPKHKSGESLSKEDKEFYNKSEYCKWVDESYLLLGKAHLYNHDFTSAAEAFEYVIKEFSYEPIKYDALIWLARAYNESGKYNKAKEVLERLDGDDKFPKRLKQDLSTTYADYYLKQKQFDDAISRIKVAIDYTKKRNLKARYKFILAQLYQKYNQYNNATNLYSEVIKINPQYEMTFNAQINRATSYDLESGNSKEIKKELNKMLKDDKNIDYQDQIYFALANILYKEKDIEGALTNYKLSISKSVSNTSQKALSYLSIGDIYFNKPEYKPAQMYYDSAVALLPTDYPDYDKLYQKSKILNELVLYATTVELQDSLQKLAKMSEKERNRIVDAIIQKIKDEENRIKQEEQQQHNNATQVNMNQQNISRTNLVGAGKWYFYNPSSLSFGQSEFKKKWGQRKNEDNWRRKNKNIVNDQIVSDEEGEDSENNNTPKASDLKNRDYYLKNIPMTDSAIAKSNKKIEDALYKLGVLYKEKMEDYPLSILTFEELVKRFPKSEYLLSSYYELMNLNKLTKNTERENYYKNIIINQFPKSNYAKMLTNPNYFKEFEAKTKDLNDFYSQTYNDFNNRNYQKVINNYSVADSMYKNNNLMPKFMLLKAMSYGGIGDINSYKACLKDIISKYPKKEEEKSAKDLLAFLEKGKINSSTNNNQSIVDSTNTNNNVITKKEKKEEKIYNLDENLAHYYILVVENKVINVNQIKYNIVNFNTDNYSLSDFKVSALILSDKYQIITVKSLPNKKDAVQYFKRIKEEITIFQDLIQTEFYQFVITNDNYTNFYYDKDVNKYLKFFNKNYPLDE